MNLWICSYQIGKFSVIIFFKKILYPYIYKLYCLMLPQMSLKICSFLFLYFLVSVSMVLSIQVRWSCLLHCLILIWSCKILILGNTFFISRSSICNFFLPLYHLIMFMFSFKTLNIFRICLIGTLPLHMLILLSPSFLLLLFSLF